MATEWEKLSTIANCIQHNPSLDDTSPTFFSAECIKYGKDNRENWMYRLIQSFWNCAAAKPKIKLQHSSNINIFYLRICWKAVSER